MILFRSIFGQLLAPYLIGLSILTFILSLETIYRLIHLIVSKGVYLTNVALMLVYRLPQIITTTMSLSIVIAVTVVIVRLSLDLELTALQASGVSLFQLSQPIFVFGAILTVLGLINTLWLQPTAYAAFEKEKLQVLKSQTSTNLQPKILNYDFADKVLYIQEKTKGTDTFKGIFITDQQYTPNSIVISASTGKIAIRAEERDVEFDLSNGNIYLHGETEDHYRVIDFEKLRYLFQLPTIIEVEESHIMAVPTVELISSSRNRAMDELMLRLTTPLACFSLALAVIPIAITPPRIGKTRAYLRALILVIVYYSLWLIAKEGTSKGTHLYLFWMPPIVTSIYGLYSLYKVHHNLGNLWNVLRSLFFRKSHVE